MVTLPPILAVVAIPYLVYAAIATAASYVATRFLTPKPKSEFDSKPTTLATRGSVIPKIIGHVRVPPIFAWAGLREQVSSGGGGKGLGGGSSASTSVYMEAAWHLLAVGPVDVLYAIFQAGKCIHTTPIFRSETPSGTSFQCPNNQGTFTIYWGECNQPVNTVLGDPQLNSSEQPIFPGVLSRWPKVCYVVWNKKNIGPQPYWPQIEYEIAAWPDSSTTTLTESSPTISATTGGTDPYIRNGNDGVNPAHALWMLITAPYPDGAGVDPSEWNLNVDDFEALGVLCEQEHTPINFVLQDGQDIHEAIAAIMSDITVFMPQIGDTLRIRPIRAVSDPTTLPTVSPSVNASPDPEIERIQGNLIADRPQFSFRDRAINFTPFTINFGNDAIARLNQRPKITKVQLQTISDRFTAYYIAERRRLEFLERVTVKLTVTRQARTLNSGDAFNLTGVGVMRISTVKISTKSPKADLECLLDQYTLAASGTTYGDQGGLIIGTEGAEADLLVVPFLVPKSLSPNPSLNYFGVARVRADDAVSGAAVWLSNDGTSYVQAGEQDRASAGGTMNSPILATTVMTAAAPLMAGPTFTSYNDDYLDLPDYTGSTTNWMTGQLMAIIDSEVFYLESVSAVDGGIQLNGMIRASYGTVAAAHAANAPIVVFARSWISRINTGTLVSGTTVYIKTVPFTYDDVVDITTVTAVPLAIDANATSTITLTSPTDAGIVWTAGYEETITWKTLGNQYHTPGGPTFSGGIDIYFSEDSGTTFQAVILNTTNTGSHIWTIPVHLETSSTCVIKVQSHISPNVYDISSYPFEIVASPVITITNPPEDDYTTTWYGGTPYHITWTCVPNTDPEVDLAYTFDDVTWIPIVVGTPNDGDFVWVPPTVTSDSITFRVRVTINGHSNIGTKTVPFHLNVS